MMMGSTAMVVTYG